MKARLRALIIATIWVVYGFVVFLPRLYNQYGDGVALFLLLGIFIPLTLGALIWFRVAINRSTASRFKRPLHRLAIESLFGSVVAFVWFVIGGIVFGLLTSVDSVGSMQIPFTWLFVYAPLMLFGLGIIFAAGFALIAAVSYVPDPPPGGYRDVTPFVNDAPVKKTVDYSLDIDRLTALRALVVMLFGLAVAILTLIPQAPYLLTATCIVLFVSTSLWIILAKADTNGWQKPLLLAFCFMNILYVLINMGTMIMTPHVYATWLTPIYVENTLSSFGTIFAVSVLLLISRARDASGPGVILTGMWYLQLAPGIGLLASGRSNDEWLFHFPFWLLIILIESGVVIGIIIYLFRKSRMSTLPSAVVPQSGV